MSYEFSYIYLKVLFFTGLLRRPKRVQESEEFHYTEKDLPHIINPLEAKLGM